MSAVDETSKPAPASLFPRFLLFVAVVALAFALWLRSGVKRSEAEHDLLPVGAPAPTLIVTGWTNGPTPDRATLAGKVLVLDGFAYWCGPCRAAAPEMKELHAKYASRGAVFIGLTTEGADSLDKTQEFLKQTGLPFVAGYGAGPTMDALKIAYIPCVYVIGKDGRVAWTLNEEKNISLDAAIERALGT